MARIVSIVGRSGVGKTTYLESLLPELTRRGVRVAVVKHDAGGFEMDRPGKDTWRYARAGSAVVAISGPDRFALIERRPRELSLDEVAARLPEVDLILTEGFKREGRNRVELLRRAHSEAPVLASSDLVAVLSDFPVHPGLPIFPLDDPTPFAEFLLRLP
jgi:molybdopterin-guanine dinucleotide biosynthesis adapter protein